jgi:hypothetical protein
MVVQDWSGLPNVGIIPNAAYDSTMGARWLPARIPSKVASRLPEVLRFLA